MAEDFKTSADAILNRVVTSDPRVPGVVAMLTDRHRTIYEGAAGKRRMDRDSDMTTDSVFAIFSTTKAITGTGALQLVEEGKLDLDVPAKTYVPEIGELQVIEGFDAHGDPRLRAPKRDVTTRMLLLHTARTLPAQTRRSMPACRRRPVAACHPPAAVPAPPAGAGR